MGTFNSGKNRLHVKLGMEGVRQTDTFWGLPTDITDKSDPVQ